jgi:hypothetical protein
MHQETWSTEQKEPAPSLLFLPRLQFPPLKFGVVCRSFVFVLHFDVAKLQNLRNTDH